MRSLSGLVGLGLAVLCVTAACGNGTEAPDAADAVEAGWAAQALGPATVDTAAFVLTRGDTTVVVTASDGGDLLTWTSTNGAPFEGPVTTSSPPGSRPSTGVAGADEFVVFGSEHGELGTFVPVVWRSTDGVTWEVTKGPAGLDQPADVNDVVSIASGYVAVGTLRAADDPAGRLVGPAIWRSSDGTTWEAADPGADGDGYVAAIASVDGVLVATGRLGDEPAVWRSLDDGVSWNRQSLPRFDDQTVFSVDDLATSDGVVVAVGSAEAGDGERPLIVRSTDRGVTWEHVDLDEAQAAELEYGLRIEGGDDGFSIVGSRSIGVVLGESSSVCYEDLGRCRSDADPVLLTSADGSSWDELDLGELTDSEYFGVVDVVSTSNRTLLLGVVELELTTWIWSGGGTSLPRATTPPETSPEDTLPTAEYGGEIEEGLTYRYPLYIHCGMDYLGELNGSYWYRTDGGGAEAAFPPAHWPVAQQTIYGFVTLVDGTIEYSISPGERIAVYEPSDERPPGCD